MLRKIGLLLLTVFLCLLPRTSLAGDNGYSPASSIDPPIVVGGGWSLFTWTTAAQSFNVEGPFTFSSTGSTAVTVTDDFCPGDQFNVYDFGVLIGTTNAVPSSNNCPSLTPDAALASPVYSHGQVYIGTGQSFHNAANDCESLQHRWRIPSSRPHSARNSTSSDISSRLAWSRRFVSADAAPARANYDAATLTELLGVP
jgi:hypothetical protein